MMAYCTNYFINNKYMFKYYKNDKTVKKQSKK